MINAIRWKLAKLLSFLAWAATPEPARSQMRAVFHVQWHDFIKEEAP